MRTAEDTTKSLSQGRLDRPHLSYTLPSLLAALLFLSLYLCVDSYLDVVSILGIRIRTTKRHWDAVVKKHESLADLKHAAENTLRAPRYVRLSKEDARIFLYYAPCRKYFLCVVCRHLNGHGFLVTAYLTDRIKKGITIYEAHPDHL